MEKLPQLHREVAHEVMKLQIQHSVLRERGVHEAGGGGEFVELAIAGSFPQKKFSGVTRDTVRSADVKSAQS